VLGIRQEARRGQEARGALDDSLMKQGKKMERGGAQGGHVARRKEGDPARAGGYCGVWAAGNSRKRRRRAVNRGTRWGSCRGEKSRACGPSWKSKKHGAGPKE
jgi:hypothetical protein